jgi:hypothetical protein
MVTDEQSPDPKPGTDGKFGLDRADESQDFVDQSKIDFDPDEGLYSGTAVHGGSEIPGPHQDNETGEVNLDEAEPPAADQDDEQP